MTTIGQRSILCALLLFTMPGCSDEPTGTSLGAGRYRLDSVAGKAVPAALSLTTGHVTYYGGDLHLRGSSTFAYGIQGLQPAYEEGQWSVAGADLELTSAFTGLTTIAHIQGDSVVLRLPVSYSPSSASHLNFTFRLDAAPVTEMTGAYILSSVMGRDDRRYEWKYPGHSDTYFFEVQFDTITFLDELFFKRHRSERRGQVGWDGSSGRSFRTVGSYHRSGDVLELRHFDFGLAGPPVDTLFVGGSIVRKRLTHDMGTPVELEEVYVWGE